MRLRVFDLACPWFWIVVFYQRGQGLNFHHFGPPRWRRGWLHIWQWEPLPDERPMVARDA